MVRPVVTCLTALLLAGPASAAREAANRYSAATWHSALGLPDDWHKPMANDRGALLYDFGPGPYAKPLTVVEFGFADQTPARDRQWLEAARVPIVRTELSAGDARLAVTTLSVAPDAVAATEARFARYERLDGISGALGWAQPAGTAHAEFRNVAWGINRPVRYRVRVEPGAQKRVALGFCESYKPRLNERVAVMQIEGAAEQVADLALTAARNTPQAFLFEAADANRDGWIDVTVFPPQGKDPNPALAMISVYPTTATKLTREDLVGAPGAGPDLAELRIACGTEMLAQPGRIDAMQAEFSGAAAPVLTVRTGRVLQPDSRGGLVMGDRPFVTTFPRAERIENRDGRWVLHFPRGTTRATALVFSGHATAASVPAGDAFDFGRAAAAVTARWQKSDVPFDHLAVGDPAIQRVVDASLRTFYQARERINGVGQFNSSFSLYRGLWSGDVVYLINVACQLGDFARARESIDTLMSFQNSQGLIDELPPLVIYRATPATFWALERYARMSGDWESVRRHWPAILRGVQGLRAARAATLAHPEAANAGLLPAAFNDGGLADIGSEYSSVYWSITGLRAMARAAQQIGRAEDGAAIERLAGEFSDSFRRASQRDLRSDAHGNRYLPVRVGLTGRDELPQLAQWGVVEFCLFGAGPALDSEFARGSLAMLEATETEGLVPSVGWMRDGLWVGFSSLYAHAPLLMGRHEKAADLLYAIADHATPMGGWVEEQSLRNAPARTAGDEPHCWAASLFVRLTLSMLACEYRDAMHLLLSTPPEWLRPGMVNRLTNIQTPGGPLSLTLTVAADGRSASLDVAPPRAGDTVLHLQSLRAAGFRLDDPRGAADTLPVAPGAAATYRFVR